MKKLLQKHELCTKRMYILRRKEKFILSNFRIKEKLMLWISWGKRRSFSTQEIGRNMTFPYYLRTLHNILRTEKDDLSVLKKTIR